MNLAEAYGVMARLEKDHAGEAAKIEGAEKIERFLFAGRAAFTLVSKASGARFTYRVKAKKDGTAMFVSVLTGQNNEGDYEFLGTIFPPKPLKDCRGPRDAVYKYFHGKRSRIGEEAPSAKAFAWFVANLFRGYVSDTCEVWHAGRCGKCGRKLTVPESIAMGLGPECAAGAS